MKFDNNTIAIFGIIGVATVAITAAVIVHETEIATGLVALGSTAIGGVIGYLAKSQVPEKEQIYINNPNLTSQESIDELLDILNDHNNTMDESSETTRDDTIEETGDEVNEKT